MASKLLFVNGNILSNTGEKKLDSLAVSRGRIVAVGRKLGSDPEFASFTRFDLKGKTITPGLVDAHTHFVYLSLCLGHVQLEGLTSIEACLSAIKKHADQLPRNAWVVGDGYSPDRFKKRMEPDRFMLDRVTGGRPAFMFSKDQHSAWVNSKALELAGYTADTPDPKGARIEHLPDGSPSGILREYAYLPVFDLIPPPTDKEKDRLYNLALDQAYQRGVTGVHSFDGPEGFQYLMQRAEKRNFGVRVTYYPAARLLPKLIEQGISYGTGTEFFRIAGIKIFADGSLGSQTALCFNSYIGSKSNRGIEVTSTEEIRRYAKKAAHLGLPVAVHAIGDKAVANVLDALEPLPLLKNGARHRIEHLQQVRRGDIARVKRINVVASMQPSHCPSDIDIARKYWGPRARNAYVFRTLLDKGIDLAFGSDAPIEPLEPLPGMAAAIRRARKGSSDLFYPEERITAPEALYGFTAGPAIAENMAHERGFLLPGYVADFVIFDDDITRIPATRLYSVRPLATIIAGEPVYTDRAFRL